MSDFKDPALLLWIDGETIKQQWALSLPETSIGRWQDNDIVIDDRWVSRHHARIRRQGDTYFIEDLDSKNGTRVNGMALGEAKKLKDGDIVQVTPLVKMTFVDYGSTAPLPTHIEPDRLVLDPDSRRVQVKGQVLDPPLSPAQFTLLALLNSQPGRVFSRDEIIERVWTKESAEGVSDEAIDALVRRIRLRIREVDPEKDYIETVRGYGFKINRP